MEQRLNLFKEDFWFLSQFLHAKAATAFSTS